METVQQSVVHLDHGGLPPPSQMAFAQRSSALHRGQAGEGSPYKPPRLHSSNPTASAPLSPGTIRSTAAAYPGYASAATAQTMRYVPYGAAPYREAPYTIRNTPERMQQQPGGPVPVEYVREGQTQPRRISLLPSGTAGNNPDYLPALARNRIQPMEQIRVSLVVPSGPVQLDMNAGQPFKKIRLGEQKQEVQQPLRIDTREQPAYNPQVEAISPTLPNDSLQEDASFRSTKDDLLQQIGKVDREIAKAETQILKLKKKQQELEEAASKPLTIKKEEEEVTQPKHQSLAQKIYADNRKRSVDAHGLLDRLGPKVDLPLYNQPSDTSVYHENKRRHLTFKSKLMKYFKVKHADREGREKYLTATYSKMMQEWLRKVEKIESSVKRKSKESKNREFFEKVFPELRKQREDRERFNRVGARVKSEADVEEIIDGIHEQEMEDKKMRSYAVIPPILLDAQQRKLSFVNNNGRIEDFTSEYKERQLLNVWTDTEREIFKEKYLQHPKNFGVIASYLDKKSVCDCIQFYYLSKKTENYKQLLRKSRQRTRGRNNPHGKVTATNQNCLDILSGPAGVTTRLQREQQQKQDTQPTSQQSLSSSMAASNNNNNPPASVSPDMSEGLISSIPTTPPAVAAAMTSSATVITTATEAGSLASASPPPPPVNEADQPPPMDRTTTSGSGEAKVENKKKERRKEDKKKKKEEEAALETSDEECTDIQDKGGPHPCVVCKTIIEQFLQSRPLPRSHAAQYSLREEDVPPGSRVCNTCRCKSVRSRHTQCPIPTCPNSKGRVKRLRSLPGKWTELSQEIKDPIILEFQIPPTVTKSCTACFNRISRRLAPHMGDSPPEDGDNPSSMLRWSDEETEAVRRALRECGLNWSRVAERIGSSKTSHQCKNFYFNYRKKLGLDQLVQEYNKNHLGEERKPTLTDEEESGSSTSSCDEMTSSLPPLDNSDTDSAHSPRTQPPSGVPNEEKLPAVGGLADVCTTPMEIDASLPIANGSMPGGVNPTLGAGLSEPRPPPGPSNSNKEDYDSSATETADEGQGGADMDTSRNSPKPASGPTAPESNGPSSPLRMRSVKDLMLGVIEMSLMKTPANSGAPIVNVSAAPTISSILKTDHRQDITFVREFKPAEVKMPLRTAENQNLATLSVVNTSLSHGHLAPPSSQSILQHMPQMQATITPCPPGPQAPAPSGDLPKEGLVVVQVQQALRESSREPEGVTLDLSIKRPRDCNSSPLASIVRDPSPMHRGTESPYIHHPHHRDSPVLPPQTTLHPLSQTTLHPIPPSPHHIPQTTLHNIPPHNSGPPPAHSKPGQGGPMHHPSQPSVSVYSRNTSEATYYPHPVVVSTEQLRNVSKSPSVFVSSVGHGGNGGMTPHLVMNQNQPPRNTPQVNKLNKMAPSPLSSKLSPKLPPAKGGSITHGTPVSNSLPPGMQPRYEGLLRQMTPPQQPANKDPSLAGSITQGTPVHLHHHDKRERGGYEYFKHAAPPAQQYYAGRGENQVGFPSPYPRQPPASYTTEQQMSSRQIIMNDYITSQQMHTPRRADNKPPEMPPQQRGVNTSPHYYPNAVPGIYMTADGRLSRSSPAGAEAAQPPSHHTPPPRQGVIQRHNTIPSRPGSGGGKPPSPAPSPHQRLHHFPHPHHYPPGHEAFSSLVDVAVQQPSLPVPDKQRQHMHHEGLVKTMADNARILEHQMERERLVQVAAAREREREHQSEQRYRERENAVAERERFAAQSAARDRDHQERLLQSSRDQERLLQSSRDQERLLQSSRDQERLLQSSREREQQEQQQQQQQRFNASRERENHQIREQREREIQQQQQQQMHMQQLHQQQMHRQQQARIAAGAEFEHRAQQMAAAVAYRDQMAEREATRMLVGGFQQREGLPPRHHQPPPPQQHQQQQQQQQQQHVVDVERENPPPPSRPPAPSGAPAPSPRGGNNNNGGGGGGDSTMTAASLIDAIITHQINQSSEPSSGGQQGPGTGQPQTRPGDRLFQSFHREQPGSHQQNNPHAPESNGKSSPLKSSHSPSVAAMDRKPSPSQQDHPANPPSSRDCKAITLGEHIDSIITKDLNSSGGNQSSYPMHHRAIFPPHHPYHMVAPPPNPTAEQLMAADREREREQHSWKLRRVLQQKEFKEMEREREKSAANSRSSTPGGPPPGSQSDERQIIRIAQPSSPRQPGVNAPGNKAYPPPDPGHHWLPNLTGEGMGMLPRRYAPPATQEQSSGNKSHLSALDYVKNRIVEVMRTSEDEKTDASRHLQHFVNKGEDKAAAFQQEERSEGVPDGAKRGEDHKERCDSPGDMVIDEGAEQSKNHSPGGGGDRRTCLSPAAPGTASFVAAPSTYTYPYSALSVPPPPASKPQAPPPPLKPSSPADGTARPPEPAPLLSAQYEPLSDED